MCGDNRDPTVFQYSNNNSKLLSLKRAKTDLSVSNYSNGSIDEILEQREPMKLSKVKKMQHTWPVNL